jgi:hypothetical protein
MNANPFNISPRLNMQTNPIYHSKSMPQEQKRLQHVVGVFLYYARAIGSTMLVALGTLASAQTTVTFKTEKSTLKFLDYAKTNQNAKVRYEASDMILNIHSAASYLSKTKARSRAGGICFMSTPLNKDNPHPKLNGAIQVNSKII